jgi:hypothetical protein
MSDHVRRELFDSLAPLYRDEMEAMVVVRRPPA